MKKIKTKKLTLNKNLVTALTKEDSRKVMAGYTTSLTYCTGWLCCRTGNGSTTQTGGVCTWSGCQTC